VRVNKMEVENSAQAFLRGYPGVGRTKNKRPPGGGRSQPSLVYAICRLWFFSGKERMRCPVALK
jgi:hypothetical protein